MRRWLWHDVCNNVGVYETGYVVVHAIVCVVAVYMVCTIIDTLRIRFVEEPFLKYLEKGLTINERKS